MLDKELDKLRDKALSKFDLFLGLESQQFSNGIWVISADHSKEYFRDDLIAQGVIEEEDKLENLNIYEDWVKFRGDYDREKYKLTNGRWLDSKGMKGAKKVWCYE